LEVVVAQSRPTLSRQIPGLNFLFCGNRITAKEPNDRADEEGDLFNRKGRVCGLPSSFFLFSLKAFFVLVQFAGMNLVLGSS
jgi:hypothetical protein